MAAIIPNEAPRPIGITDIHPDLTTNAITATSKHAITKDSKPADLI